jgi:hypothetical protein
MTLGFTQTLTGMNTRNISWDKDGPCIRLTTLSEENTFYLVLRAAGFQELYFSLSLIILYNSLYYY